MMRGGATVVVVCMALGALTLGSDLPVPLAFDRQAVVQLIEHISEGSNASILKVPYFASRRQHPFAPREALPLLLDAAGQTPRGSPRWLLLRGVHAFACFRVGPDLVEAGYAAYEELFAFDAERFLPDQVGPMGGAMSEFLDTVAMPKGKAEGNVQRARRVLARVVTLYLTHMELDHPRLNFREATTRGGGSKELRAVVEGILTGRNATSYPHLKRAALVLSGVAPGRAVELFLSAEPLLPADDGAEVAEFYGRLVDALASFGKLDEAIAAQERLVKRTGSGEVRLALLRQQRNGGEAGLSPDLGDLADAVSTPAETADLVDTLVKQKQDESAITVLRKYLAGGVAHEAGDELWARFTLGSLLAANGRPAEARQAFRTDHLKRPFDTPKARTYARRIEFAMKRLPKSGEAQ